MTKSRNSRITGAGRRTALFLVPLLFFALSTELPIATAVKVKSDASIAQVLASISVKGRAPKTGYTRDQFGPAWKDVDKNGCDTRNDILKRDLVTVIYKSSDCVILSGVLNDPYSGEDIQFLRGVATSSLVQIDHVVALSNAWQTGAFALTLTQRTALANDPLNLLAVKGSLNSQKSDGDAATWLPPLKSFRCDYVARQLAVKNKYGLWLTASEKDAIILILSKCPNQLLPAK